MSNFRGFGSILLLGGIGYLGWRNRFRIQQFLESRGIQTPFLRGSLSDFVQSGVSKISGKAEHYGERLGDESRRAG